jgi:hypothetical protein
MLEYDLKTLSRLFRLTGIQIRNKAGDISQAQKLPLHLKPFLSIIFFRL